jgi:hypothetical protein
MTKLKRYDIIFEHYDTGIGQDDVISLDYREGGDHVSAYEALDIITVLEEKIVQKDAEIAMLMAALEAAFDFANAHSLPCLEDAMKIALEATTSPEDNTP